MVSKLNLDKEVLELVASGRATTRADLARALGLAPSTISLSINRLIAKDVLKEEGETESTGGRPAKQLVWRDTKQRSLVIELGANHARFALVDVDGVVNEAQSTGIDISQGPTEVLTKLFQLGLSLAEQSSFQLGAAGVALPGPVDPSSGVVIGPSRMPGWHQMNVRELAQNIFGLPVLVENDARLGAQGEIAYHRHNGYRQFNDFVYVKAGSAIGGALVLDGKIQPGSKGLSGDLTHVPVLAGGSNPCSCGNQGCLDTVASAAALRSSLTKSGLVFDTNEAMINAAFNGDPQVVNAIRQAGVNLGNSLAHIVSFLNPEAVIVGGTLSGVEAFQAGIRQSLHELCLPSIMENLAVESAKSSRDAALWGLAAGMKKLAI